MAYSPRIDTTVYRLNRRWPGEGRPWSFSANQDKLFECHFDNGNLVVCCAKRDGSIIRFIVPIGSGTDFAEHILLKITFDSYNRCTFEIDQVTYRFTWRYGIYMDGRSYLA